MHKGEIFACIQNIGPSCTSMSVHSGHCAKRLSVSHIGSANFALDY